MKKLKRLWHRLKFQRKCPGVVCTLCSNLYFDADGRGCCRLDDATH